MTEEEYESRWPQPDLTVKGVMRQLNASRDMVYKLIAVGELQAYHVGRSRRIRRESVERIRSGGADAA